MRARDRIGVAALVLLGILAAIVVVSVAGRACPVQTPAQPCPDAAVNRALVVTLAAVSVALIVTPFALLGEVMARRRIVYRGACVRAARRGVLVGMVIAALAGLRLGGSLSVPIAIFVITLAGVVEWYLARRDR
ncbi:MAG: hypothetical protein ABIW50_09505 [Candidatus Limnocylindria bacterium]